MKLIARFFAFLNVLLFFPMFEFRVVRHEEKLEDGWDWAHHEIEGRNGGKLFIPRGPGLVWPDFLKKKFRLVMREKRNVPR